MPENPVILIYTKLLINKYNFFGVVVFGKNYFEISEMMKHESGSTDDGDVKMVRRRCLVKTK